MHTARAQVCVRIDETGYDRASGHIDDARVASLHLAARADCDDAVVTHEDVAVLDDLVAAHGDDACPTQQCGAAREVALSCDRDAGLCRRVSRLLLRARLRAV